jgi:hypothetical protein
LFLTFYYEKFQTYAKVGRRDNDPTLAYSGPGFNNHQLRAKLISLTSLSLQALLCSEENYNYF